MEDEALLAVEDGGFCASCSTQLNSNCSIEIGFDCWQFGNEALFALEDNCFRASCSAEQVTA